MIPANITRVSPPLPESRNEDSKMNPWALLWVPLGLLAPIVGLASGNLAVFVDLTLVGIYAGGYSLGGFH